MKNIKLILLLILPFASCTKADFNLAESAQEKFFIKSGNVIMPVIISGNTQSKTFCIILHGGPGDSAIQSFAETNSFDRMEEEFAVVYFDQRCSGLAQGNCDATNLDISHFVEDIDRLIDLLHQQYGDAISLFLLGHSWGATLALDFLINGQQRSDITGCIQSNGSHNIPMVSREEKKILMEYATSQVALGNNVDQWQEIKKQTQDRNEQNFDDRIAIVENCYKTLQPLIDADSVNVISTKAESFVRQLASSFVTSNSIKNNNNRPFYEKILAYDITDELNRITTPMGLYWGRHDLVHPPIMAQTIFNLLGSQEKEIHFFDRSHHAPMVHENEAYQQKVIDFVKKYN